MDQRKQAVHYFIRAVILLGFAFYIVFLVRNDTMVYYIAPRMELYVKLSAIALYAISVYQIYLGLMGLRGKLESCDCHHIPSRSVIKNFLVYGMFVLPLALGFLFPDSFLGSSLAAKKGVNFQPADSVSAKVAEPENAKIAAADPIPEITKEEAPGDEGDGAPHREESGGQESAGEEIISEEELDALFPADEWTQVYADYAKKVYPQEIIEVRDDIYMEMLTMFDLFLDSFVGKKVRLTGFVYREEQMSEEQFVVARFSVSCCAADAAPFGVLVHSDEAKKFADDEWVVVTGTIGKTEYGDMEMMTIEAERVETTEEPEEPYVYPNYEFGSQE